jgi:predicted metal-dependent peptidase
MKINIPLNIKVEKTHPLLESCIINMIIDLDFQFYGEFAFYLSFTEEAAVKTCGVTVTYNGTLLFAFNRDFLDTLNENQMVFVIIHECMHLLFDHIERSRGYDKRIANIAQDMIINWIIFEDLMIKEKLEDRLEIPQDHLGRNMVVFVPQAYKGPLLFEELYQWLKKDYEDWQKNGSQGLEYGNHAPAVQQRTPQMYPLEKFWEDLEENKGQTLDSHLEDEMPPEVKQQIVERITNTLSNQGLVSAELEQTLARLQESEVDYLRTIKRSLSHYTFGAIKHKSISRPNRRIEGLKGKRKTKAEINAILDTSGSMCKEHEAALSYIFQHDIIINLIQIDTEVKEVLKIKKRNELQALTIKGLGGTILTPALQKIAHTKELNRCNTVVLTDGYTDKLDLSGVKGHVLIISNNKACPLQKSNNKVKQIVIKNK